MVILDCINPCKMQMKDVEITDEHPKILLSEKHVNYITEFSKKKSPDYVSFFGLKPNFRNPSPN